MVFSIAEFLAQYLFFPFLPKQPFCAYALNDRECQSQGHHKILLNYHRNITGGYFLYLTLRYIVDNIKRLEHL